MASDPIDCRRARRNPDCVLTEAETWLITFIRSQCIGDGGPGDPPEPRGDHVRPQLHTTRLGRISKLAEMSVIAAIRTSCPDNPLAVT